MISIFTARRACILLFVTLAFSANAQDREKDRELRRSPFKLADLVVTVETKHPQPEEFGTFATFMNKLKQAGLTCRHSRYEYGVNVSCGPAANPRILIGMAFAPSRAPELLEIHSIRANGINGGELPKAGHGKFIEGLIGKGR